jgi:hypothetical protein
VSRYLGKGRALPSPGPFFEADLLGCGLPAQVELRDQLIGRELAEVGSFLATSGGAAAVYEGYAALHYLALSLSLHRIDGTQREELPELDLFLPAWIDVLSEHTEGTWARPTAAAHRGGCVAKRDRRLGRGGSPTRHPPAHRVPGLD